MTYDYLRTIYAQFSNSPTIMALIGSFYESIDPAADLDNFLSMLWDVSSAKGLGLDNWGRIVNISRRVPVTSTKFFGFQEAIALGETGATGFDQAPFYSGNTFSFYDLSDDEYRKLIMIKAATNITDHSIKSINTALMFMFGGSGNAWVDDLGHMGMAYRFDFELSDVERNIILNTDAAPRPCGVKLSVVDNSDTALILEYNGNLISYQGEYVVNG